MSGPWKKVADFLVTLPENLRSPFEEMIPDGSMTLVARDNDGSWTVKIEHGGETVWLRQELGKGFVKIPPPEGKETS